MQSFSVRNDSSLLWMTIICLIVVSSCVPPTQETITDVSIDYKKPEFQELVNLVDRQEIDSLLSYTAHPDPAFRITMINGLSAIQSEDALDSLEVLLHDPIAEVRVAAAYALGQSGNGKAAPILLQSFKNKDTVDISNLFNSNVLEAIGKTGDAALLKHLATVNTYRPSDTLLILGQTRAIYRFGLRGITLPEGTDLMVKYATDLTLAREIRQTAAHYLSRMSNISLESSKFQLSELLLKEGDVNIKMAIALALGKVRDPQVYAVLMGLINGDEDYRVKLNALRSTRNYPYIQIVEPMLRLLDNPDLRVAQGAAQYVLQKGNASDASIYRNFIKDTMHWSVKSTMFSAVLKHIPSYFTNTKKIVREQILDLYDQTTDPYQKAAYLDALAHDPLNYILMEEKGFSDGPILKTAGMMGLGKILSNPKFTSVYKNRSNSIRRQIIEIIKKEMNNGDTGAMAVGAGVLRNEDNNLKQLIDSTQFLTDILSNLSLPQEIETYNEILQTVSYLNGSAYTPKKLDYNHPIDFATLSRFTAPKATLKTSKGNITIQLMPEVAPGSVANFINLSSEDFYDNKVFHRVVNNFVIQGGCPRGDGYGSLDYSIRSELPQIYYDDEGYLGMASAGLHTEGTQFFITHSPTPHLDGKYTILGKVVSGMEAVHTMTQGDQITDVIIAD